MTAPQLVFLLALCAAGCDRGPALYHVSGSVTYDDKPLPAGQIFFDPDVSKGNDGPQGFAHIKAGEFDTAEGGRGVRGGPYVIRIQGFDGKPGNELPLGKPLFTNFRESRDLPKEKSEQNFDVLAKGKDM